MKRSLASVVAVTLALVVAGTALLTISPAGAKDGAQNVDPAAALQRTRKTVRMLDDIYKTTVVLITDKYVNDEDDFPAGSAAIALFDAIKKKGWHEARLLDATGEPYEEKNSPRDAFERTAIKQLKSGNNYYEQVITKEGKPATICDLPKKTCAQMKAVPAGSDARSRRDEEMYHVPPPLCRRQAGRTNRRDQLYAADRVNGRYGNVTGGPTARFFTRRWRDC